MKNVTKILLTGILFNNLFAVTFQDDISLNRKVDLLSQAVIKLIENDKNFNKMLIQMSEDINGNKIAIQNNLIQINKNKKDIMLNKRYLKRLSQAQTIYYAIVDVPKLNLREKPSLNSKILKVLNKGDKLLIEDFVQCSNRVWYKVKDGYISSNYVNLAILKKMNKIYFKQQKQLKANKVPKKVNILNQVDINKTIISESNLTTSYNDKNLTKVNK